VTRQNAEFGLFTRFASLHPRIWEKYSLEINIPKKYCPEIRSTAEQERHFLMQGEYALYKIKTPLWYIFDSAAFLGQKQTNGKGATIIDFNPLEEQVFEKSATYNLKKLLGATNTFEFKESVEITRRSTVRKAINRVIGAHAWEFENPVKSHCSQKYTCSRRNLSQNILVFLKIFLVIPKSELRITQTPDTPYTPGIRTLSYRLQLKSAITDEEIFENRKKCNFQYFSLLKEEVIYRNKRRCFFRFSSSLLIEKYFSSSPLYALFLSTILRGKEGGKIEKFKNKEKK